MTLAGSYVDASEAETYFEGNSRAEDLLEDEDLNWYLKEATNAINALPLRGRRYEEKYIENGVQKDNNSDDLTQILEFPRIIDGVTLDWDHGTHKPIVPDLVKRACLEEAIAIYQFNNDTDRTERQTMKEDGVKSYSLGGDYSETLGPSNQERQCGLISKEAFRLMRRYIGAVVR